jgi:hypothetical protein
MLQVMLAFDCDCDERASPARLAKDFGRAIAKAIDCPSLELLHLSSNWKTMVGQLNNACDRSFNASRLQEWNDREADGE